MNSKFKSLTLIVALLATVGFTSCNEEEEPEAEIAKPTISNLEVGDSNSMKAEVGHELHLDAEIVAEGKIDKIKVELHPEDGPGEDIEAEYTSYAGLKNADFHEDLEIPDSAAVGEYHFHMTVIDQEGQSTSVEAEVEIEAK
jgi:hypothetical protein